LGESNGVQNMGPSIWDESNWVQGIGPLLKGNLIGIQTIETSFWGESNGKEGGEVFPTIEPSFERGESNGSLNYWAFIWEGVMGVQTLGPSFGGKTKGVSKVQTIGPSN
jgi:hypothetical protein